MTRLKSLSLKGKLKRIGLLWEKDYVNISQEVSDHAHNNEFEGHNIKVFCEYYY